MYWNKIQLIIKLHLLWSLSLCPEWISALELARTSTRAGFKKKFLIGGAGVTYTKNVSVVFLCIIGKEYWASEVCWKKI